MSQALIRSAFETRLKTWADGRTPALPVAWENREFAVPNDGARYCRAFLLPARTQSETLARTDRAYRGIFQVSFYMPIGPGAGAGEALAASLDEAFAHTFTQSSIRVWLRAPFSAAAPLQLQDRFVIPVSAPYEVHVL